MVDLSLGTKAAKSTEGQMKKSPKHVFKSSMVTRGFGGGIARPASKVVNLELDKESVALFAGIHASTEFTAEAAHRAFAGIKRRK